MAAAHMVKCLFCGKMFDAQEDGKDKIWYKPRNNRYAHIECGQQNEQNKTQEQKDFEIFYRYVKDNQKNNFDFVKFKKIVEAWKKDYNYTYNGMYKTLVYFYEVKGNSKKKFEEGSIGIIPFCYNDAYNYYYNIFLASQRAGTGDYNAEKKQVIEIAPPVAKTPQIKLFNLDMEDSDEE